MGVVTRWQAPRTRTPGAGRAVVVVTTGGARSQGWHGGWKLGSNCRCAWRSGRHDPNPRSGYGVGVLEGGGGGGRTRLCLKLNVSGRKLDVNLKLSTQPLRGLSGATKPLPTRAGRPPACWEPRRASLAISMWQLHVGLGVGLEPRICTARSDLATRAQSRRSHQTAACSRKRARGADSLRGNAPRSRQSLMLSRPEEARGKQCV